MGRSPSCATVGMEEGKTESSEEILSGVQMTDKSIRILCLDDEEIISECCQQFLQEEGYDVFASTDSYDALDILRTGEIDMLIQDYNRPGLNGGGLLKVMKADDELKNIPVIISSACARDWVAKKLREFDIDIDHDLAGFIKKPFKVQDFVALVGRTVKPIL